MKTPVRVNSHFSDSTGLTLLRPIPLPPDSLALPVGSDTLGFRRFF